MLIEEWKGEDIGEWEGLVRFLVWAGRAKAEMSGTRLLASVLPFSTLQVPPHPILKQIGHGEGLPCPTLTRPLACPPAARRVTTPRSFTNSGPSSRLMWEKNITRRGCPGPRRRGCGRSGRGGCRVGGRGCRPSQRWGPLARRGRLGRVCQRRGRDAAGGNEPTECDVSDAEDALPVFDDFSDRCNAGGGSVSSTG